jgi:hypothetical protein
MNSFREVWQKLNSPAAGIPFLVSGLCVAMLGAGVYDLSKQWFGEDAGGIGRIIAVALCVLILMIVWFRAALRRPVALTPQPHKAPEPRKGLIVLVGGSLTPCQFAIEHHNSTLQHCWLIYSEFSNANADALADMLAAKGAIPHLKLAADPFQARHIRDCVEEAYREAERYGLGEHDIIADFTGMPGPASIGVALASLSPNRATQYVKAVYPKDKPPYPEAVWEYLLAYEDVVPPRLVADAPDERGK